MQRLTDQELLNLLNDTESDRAERKQSFDIYPMPSAKLSDLSRTIFENEYLPQAFASDVLEANGRSYEERLSSCRLITAPDSTIVLGRLSITGVWSRWRRSIENRFSI